VQQVRSRLHDSIQSLHAMMPLWGIDHWVPLGSLFVDVNILESLSSSRRSELDDLWQDFTTGNSNYRSLDRIGLGKEQQRISGLAVLEHNTNLMVVGKPGSGKTTYLQRIVTECNDGKLQAQRIPLLIKLRDFVDDGRKYAYNLEQFLGQLWWLSNADIELVLNQGLTLVLLDGLDEVTGEAGKQIAKEIKRFARVYPQVQVVVTCRTQSQEWRFERFDYVEVADFNEKQVRAFVAHWFATVCTDAGETKTREFLEQLFREENKPIRELAITPILLSLTCAVFHQTGKFYSKRSKLYEEGLELLLVQWDKSREVERDEIYQDLLMERKLDLLSYVAVKKFEQEKYVLFEQDELEGYIGEFLGIEHRESQGVLQAIAFQHGLLIERAQKVWSFSHLTFQEYLVAKWFCDQIAWSKLVSYITHKSWREVFLLVVEMLHNPDNLLQLMKVKLDTLLVGEERTQQFLTYVNNKSLMVNLPYRQSTRRACYFAMELCPERILEAPLNPDFSLPRTLETRFNQTLGTYYVPAYVYALASEALDLAIDLALILQLNTAIIFSDYPIEEIAGVFDLVFDLKVKLAKPLDDLRKELPDSHSNWVTWWKDNGLLWSEKFRSVINSYRNVGYDWKFNTIQRIKLQKYHDASTVLAYCLNSNCMVSDVVKQKIEETLLLPIAEIENRK